MRASMKAAVAVLMLGLVAWVAVPVAVGQDKPAESGALDPRLKPLIGTWEGHLQLRSGTRRGSGEEERVLVIQEQAGQLEGRFGIPGKGLERVVLATALDTGRPRISFKVSSGNTYELELLKEDWLSGKMVLTGGSRSGSSSDRPVQLERKK